MKKKLLEKDSFYLALFACVCLVAVGGVWFTKNNVDELASNSGLEANKNSEDEIHLIEKDKNDAVPTTTETDENLKKAKEKAKEESSKLSLIGDKVVREYSEKQPSYSKTLDLWEIHKGIDVSASKGQEVKSLMDGTVVDVFKDDKFGMSIKVKYEGDITVVYSNLDENVKVQKNQKVKQSQALGIVGNTTKVESEDGIHVHLEAYKGNQSIDPMSLIK